LCFLTFTFAITNKTLVAGCEDEECGESQWICEFCETLLFYYNMWLAQVALGDFVDPENFLHLCLPRTF